MISFVKKFLAFNKTKSSDIKNEDINKITDDEAKEYLKKMPVESLLDLNRKEEEIYLQKGLFTQFDGFIACIGKPGQGKSSLCSAYYKIFYGIDKEIFSISNASLSFTKGLWILKQTERQKIKQNIDKDIIDVEGFQVDELSTWKYIMIVAFIATDLIVVNKTERKDDIKKILSIVSNSLDKMKKLGLPRILKNIWVQIEDDRRLPEFENMMDSLDNNIKKWEEKGIKLYPFFLEQVGSRDLRKVNDNILEVDYYLEQVKDLFSRILKIPKHESVSTLLSYIDNFNNTMNGKDTFDMNHIKEAIKIDFDNSYSIVKSNKETQLLQEFPKDKFLLPKDSNESFIDFISRHKINFSFDQKTVIEKFSFYKSSNEFDKIYNELLAKKDYKADSNIFKFIYDSLIEKVKVEERIERDQKELEERLKQQELDAKEKEREHEEARKKKREQTDALDEFENQKIKIDEYFRDLKFYADIDSYSSYKYDLRGNYSSDLKSEYNNKLKKYYYDKEKEKRNIWETQINNSKYITAVQSYGENECVNGHKFSDLNVGCGRCDKKGVKYEDRLLYWVDAKENYAICKNCNIVRHVSEKIKCGGCNADCKCKVKFLYGYSA